MGTLRQLWRQYRSVDCGDLGKNQLARLADELQRIPSSEIRSAEDGRLYIELLRKFREAVAGNVELNGKNFLRTLNSILSVGEDGLYSNDLRFIFELIQNVDDCDYPSPDDRRLDMRFDFNRDEIVLTYNEVGFTPFNVFAITGIAEAAKNISAGSEEIGEKGIGFKSVFGVAPSVRICSGWFSFELRRDNFTIPLPAYDNFPGRCPGTQMTLRMPGKAKDIYDKIKRQYCRKDALFSRNPLLFLNKLTSLKIYNDAWRSMEFHVSRAPLSGVDQFEVERNVQISVNLHDYDGGREVDVRERIVCSRYSCPMVFSRKACQER